MITIFSTARTWARVDVSAGLIWIQTVGGIPERTFLKIIFKYSADDKKVCNITH